MGGILQETRQRPFHDDAWKNSKYRALPYFEVEYCRDLPLAREIEQVFPDMDGLSVITMTEVFRRKHDDYDFEEEVRLMYNNMVFDTSEDLPGIKKLSFANIPDFVEAVIVDPRASDELTAEVEHFCRINSIPFNGRSLGKGIEEYGQYEDQRSPKQCVRFGSVPALRDNLRIFRSSKVLSGCHRLLSAKSGRAYKTTE